MQATHHNTANPRAVRAPAMPAFQFSNEYIEDCVARATGLTSHQVLDMLRSGRVVWLGNPAAEYRSCASILLYSPYVSDFFVLTVRLRSEHCAALIVVVETLEAYETQRKRKMEAGLLNRACRSGCVGTDMMPRTDLGPTRTQMRRMEVLAARKRQKNARQRSNCVIVVDYRLPSGVIDRKHLVDVPGHDTEPVRSSPVAVVEQEGFWPWFGNALCAKGIQVESVVALMIKPKGRRGMPLQIS